MVGLDLDEDRVRASRYVFSPVILMVEVRSATWAAGLFSWASRLAARSPPAAAAPIEANKSRRPNIPESVEEGMR